MPKKSLWRDVLCLLLVILISGMGNCLLCSIYAAYASSGNQWMHLQARKLYALPKGCVNDHKTDYPGAIDCIVNPKTFDCNVTKPKAPCTYESAKRPTDYSINFVVIHDIEGTAIAGINTFHNRKSQVSVHYVVDTDGTVYQVLHEKDIAYHAGNYWYNQHAIGIEHAGYSAQGYQWYNTAQYQASARLTAYLLQKYNIPLDHAHVLSHGLIPSPTLALSPNHTDPGPYWLWDYYLELIHKQGIPYTPVALNPAIFTLHKPVDIVPLGAAGKELAANYSFASLYNGPSTASGLIPHSGGNSMLDELSNIEPGTSYVYTDRVSDPAGSGKTMYQIWYGVEAHIRDPHVHDPQHSKYANARQVWLAVDDDSVTRGYGIVIWLTAATKVYSHPDAHAIYQIGDAPTNSMFVAPMGVTISHGVPWYAINYNHRQAWVLASAVMNN